MDQAGGMIRLKLEVAGCITHEPTLTSCMLTLATDNYGAAPDFDAVALSFMSNSPAEGDAILNTYVRIEARDEPLT